MLIDWFTVGAQALNFLILVWLMKHFLYKPILHAIDEREKGIAAKLSDAAAKETEAHRERDEFQHKNEEFDKQRATLLSQATNEAKAERQRLLEDARAAAAALSARRQETLRSDAHNLSQAIRRRTEQEVFAIARKALTDLATTGLEERMGEVFIRRLREMDPQATDRLGKALRTAPEPALVRSAFDLPAEQRAAIQTALNEAFLSQVRVRFESSPDLVSGIELTSNGQKVGWSIKDYLGSLEKGVDELLKEKDKPQARAQAADDLTQEIAKRAYDLYEQGGRKRDSADQNWSQAEREIRKGDAKAGRKPETKGATRPQAKVEPEARVEPEPEAQSESKVKVESKPDARVADKTAGKVEPEPNAQAEPAADAKVPPKPETRVEPKAEEPTSLAKSQ